ncbi:MAG TPA: hypothetical protein VE398_25550 [Acidobacteriota bacterium]|nr:hypothetical protein [Acidobacteriota bacterium]
MRLLAPNVGWVVEANRLYWTTDNGIHWVDITPRTTSAPWAEVENVGVFFLDISKGWVMLSQWDQSLRDWRLDIAKTSDGGASWSIAPLSYPDLLPTLQDAMAGPAGICFVDPLHGWIDMAFAGNSKPGKLLATKDGGRTWTWLSAPVIAGDIYFVTTLDGWLNGGPDSSLYVTHDGGESWRDVTLEPPPQVGAATGSTYYLPVFIDAQHGFTAVNYSGIYGTPPKFVIFATEDGGKTWEARRVLAEAGKPSIGSQIPFCITDSVAFVPTGAGGPSAAVVGVPLGGEFKSDLVVSSTGMLEISFADRMHGWLLKADGDLLSTTDGGSTWVVTAPRTQTKMGNGGERHVPADKTEASAAGLPYQRQDGQVRRAGWNRFTDRNGKFEFEYPASYFVCEQIRADEPTSWGPWESCRSMIPICGVPKDGGTVRACVALPNADYKGTNFSGAAFSVSILETGKSERKCLGGDRGPLHSEAINGVKFVVSWDAGAAAGHYMESYIYRDFRDNVCYELDLNIASASIGAFDPGTVKEFDSGEVRERLRQVLDTFRFVK